MRLILFLFQLVLNNIFDVICNGETELDLSLSAIDIVIFLMVILLISCSLPWTSFAWSYPSMTFVSSSSAAAHVKKVAFVQVEPDATSSPETTTAIFLIDWMLPRDYIILCRFRFLRNGITPFFLAASHFSYTVSLVLVVADTRCRLGSYRN